MGSLKIKELFTNEIKGAIIMKNNAYIEARNLINDGIIYVNQISEINVKQIIKNTNEFKSNTAKIEAETFLNNGKLETYDTKIVTSYLHNKNSLSSENLKIATDVWV